jgi:hypothetical protein
LADLNGDGNLDVVTANPTTNVPLLPGGGASISVLLGNGDGTFRETSDANVGVTETSSVAVGDFNNDHIPDIVVNGDIPAPVVGGFGFGVSVLLGNGNGTFQVPQVLLLGAQIASVAVGDFNRDRNLDIVTGNFGGTVSVLLGNGNGTFQAPLSFSSGVGNPAALAVADFNRDGFPDLAVTNFFTNGSVGNSVALLINSGLWAALSIAPAAPGLATSASPAAVTASVIAISKNRTTILPREAPIPNGALVTPDESAGLDQLFASVNWWSDSAGLVADPLSRAKLWKAIWT